jgi:hypothetical protein
VTSKCLAYQSPVRGKRWLWAVPTLLATTIDINNHRTAGYQKVNEIKFPYETKNKDPKTCPSLLPEKKQAPSQEPFRVPSLFELWRNIPIGPLL